MIPDDETILSAYLDEELDPGERAGVEAALASDPALAGRLAGLVAARDAVAGLPRPELPCSLVSAVMAGIEASGPRRRPYFWFATAASILFALILSLRSGLLRPARPPIREGRPAPTTTELARHDHDRDPVAEPARPATARPGPVPRPRAAEAPAPKKLGPLHDPSEASRQAFLKIIDRPGLRRIVAVASIPDDEARDRVVRLLRDTARKEPEFGRLTLDPGAAADPRFSGVSDVVATLMDDAERREVLDRLGPDFTLTDEPTADPRLGTLLAELGQASAGSGPRGAGLRDDPAGSAGLQALRVEGEDDEVGSPVVPRTKAKPGRPPAPGRAARPVGSPPVPVVILIVSSRPPAAAR